MAEFSYCLLAESDTELDEKQRQAIVRYFQIRRKSGGGDCKVFWLSPTLWQLSFLDSEAQKRVLEKREHLISTPDGDVRVTVTADEKPWDHQSPKPQKVTLEKVSSNLNENREHLLENKACNSQEDEDVTEKKDKVLKEFEPRETSKCANLSKLEELSVSYKMKQTDLEKKCEAFQPQSSGFLEPAVTQKSVALGETVSFSQSRKNVPLPPSANIQDIIGENENSSFILQGKSEEEKYEEINLPSIAKYMFIKEDFECQMKHFPQLFYSFNKERLVIKICGPSQQLYKARVMLKDLLEGVKEHMLTLSHYKIKFLKSFSQEELKSKVFSACLNQVNLWVDKNIMLYGDSFKTLKEAEKAVDHAIHEVIIEVKMAARGATCTQKWIEFTTALKNNFNEPMKQVDIFSSQDCNTCSEIIIVGIFSVVKNVEHKILTYLNENTMTEDIVEIKNPNIVGYIPEILDMLNIESFSVQAIMKQFPLPAIVLSGIKHNVEKAKHAISKALDSMIWESLSISKPGAKKYFHKDGQEDCVIISKRTKCLIKLKSSSMDYFRPTESAGNKVAGEEVHQLPFPAAESTTVKQSTNSTKQAHAERHNEINVLDKAMTPEREKDSVTSTEEGFIINGVNIDISLGNIIMETADVIVNSTNFFQGPTTGVAKAIFDAAGPSIVEAVKRGKMPSNRVYCTGPGNLKSKAIMHICCNNDLQIVEKAVMNVILECEKRLYKSVAFPAIGTGQGGMDSQAVARAMMNGVDLATRNQPLTHLSTVRIVIYQKDTFQAFREMTNGLVKMKMQTGKHSNLTGHHASLPKTDTLPTSASFIPAVFDLVGFSHDSVQKAKQELQHAFQRNYKETNIYNNVISSLKSHETDKILAVIKESQVEISLGQEGNNTVSVKGLAQDVDTASCAIKNILDSKRENEIKDNKAKAKSQGAHETMDTKPKASTPGSSEPKENKPVVRNACAHEPEINKSKSTTKYGHESKDGSKISPSTNGIFRDNETQVYKSNISTNDANKHKEMSKIGTSTNSQSKDNISMANPMHSKESRDGELVVNASADHDSGNDRVMVTGAGATNFGNNQSVSSTLTTKWYCKQDGEYVPFEKNTNLVIESEFAKRSKDVVVPFKEKSLIVDLERKEATILETSQVMKVKRVDESTDSCLPLSWDEMPANNTSVTVELKKDSREYKEIERHFMETVKASKIVRIERVQNPQLWQQFEVKKKCMESKNGPSEVNEKLLFHGTVRQMCKTINEHGFNSDKGGQNGIYYGDGIYFSVDACVSTKDDFSKVDKNGLKYVYRARVLTGRFTEGKKGMKVPPLRRDTDLTDRYNSLVNKKFKPTIFVICNPHQTYPEYLIIFQKH